jgi:hypothetical protein
MWMDIRSPDGAARSGRSGGVRIVRGREERSVVMLRLSCNLQKAAIVTGKASTDLTICRN